MTCITIFVSLNTHYWIRNMGEMEYRGLIVSCYDYGHHCHERPSIRRALWFFYIVSLLTFTLELLNICLLCKRIRSRINLVLEELAIIISLLFVLCTSGFLIIGLFVIMAKSYEQFDWSFFIFVLSFILGLLDLICSLVRVVSYCRDNSFRSTSITYTSKDNHGSVRIQS
ncbi:unnamed protein product [Rotaria magnacalcarata]|uniref:Uncharacterized protein n=5 Tax=Rotaria magnacalcarata TaxID=392030 RepID=A0A816Y3B5_9BILA|nr:unnamed protein product [Rotaria magnacalcarata]CAF2154378.1 unnamed protein product [Rotaria magnacalcarata]